MIEHLEQQKKFTINQWKIFAAATIGAMIGWVVLDFRGLSAELARATRALDGARAGARDAERQ